MSRLCKSACEFVSILFNFIAPNKYAKRSQQYSPYPKYLLEGNGYKPVRRGLTERKNIIFEGIMH